MNKMKKTHHFTGLYSKRLKHIKHNRSKYGNYITNGTIKMGRMAETRVPRGVFLRQGLCAALVNLKLGV